MSADRIDVLAVLEADAVSAYARRRQDSNGDMCAAASAEWEKSKAARAAVAELIAAAAALLESQGGPWERGNAYISAKGAQNINAAMEKTRAALARVGGAA